MSDTTELTITQASKRLGRTRKTVWNMITDGRLVARLQDAPQPYYLITVESIESIEAQQQKKERNQSGN